LRCMVCKGLMERVNKAEVEPFLEPKTRLYYEDFHRCSNCSRLYWKGSHYDRIDQWLNGFMKKVSLL